MAGNLINLFRTRKFYLPEDLDENKNAKSDASLFILKQLSNEGHRELIKTFKSGISSEEVERKLVENENLQITFDAYLCDGIKEIHNYSVLFPVTEEIKNERNIIETKAKLDENGEIIVRKEFLKWNEKWSFLKKKEQLNYIAFAHKILLFIEIALMNNSISEADLKN